MLRILLTACLLFLHALSAGAGETRPQPEGHSFTIVTLVSGLEHPWSMAWLPDGRMLVTERPGRLRVVSRDFKLDPRPVGGLPKIAAQGQGGLLDVALHPQYAQNGWIYLAYAGYGDGGWSTELMRAKLKDHVLVEQQVLFRLEPRSRAGQHFGARIVFDGKGHVFLTLGDRGDRDRAQDLGDHAGSVIRLREDGSVPTDNPFVKRPGARPEIFSWGNRNVQGAALHPKTGELWTHEHGPQGGDEVNIIRSGRNYGWPVATFGREYGTGFRIGEGTQRPGMEPPLHIWVPSIAPSGMAFYAGDRFPAWRGSLLVGALQFPRLTRLELDGDKVVREEVLLKRDPGRVRDVRVGPDGYVYLLTDAPNGVLVRLEPAGEGRP